MESFLLRDFLSEICFFPSVKASWLAYFQSSHENPFVPLTKGSWGKARCRGLQPICRYWVKRRVVRMVHLSSCLLKVCVGAMRGKTKGVHHKDCGNAPLDPSWEAVLDLCEGKPPILPHLANVMQCICERKRHYYHGSMMATLSFCRRLNSHHVRCLSLVVLIHAWAVEREACLRGIAQAVSTQILFFKEKPSCTQSFPIIFSVLLGNICQEISLY